MIRLHPTPDVHFLCHYCGIDLDIDGWYMPGMRILATMHCKKCSREYFGDLPVGHGLYYPMILEKYTGKVHNQSGVKWFADWLENSYRNKIYRPIDVKVEKFRELKKPLLLNCLDGLYGHALLKLLNCEHYLENEPGSDIIVLIPKSLRWLVPDGVAEIWTLDISIKDGILWNDWLADKFKELIKHFPVCFIGFGLSHPHPEDFHIEKFTRIPVFPLDEWEYRIATPKVTFIWREDRTWSPTLLGGQVNRRNQTEADRQILAIIELYHSLKSGFSNIDFSVVGMGSTGNFPGFIHDLRHEFITEQIEREWCECYRQSICIIGLHGSNMLLPSALAGSVIELVPDDRWGNLIQDILVQGSDVRDTMFRYQFIPNTAAPLTVAQICKNILINYPLVQLNFARPWCSLEYIKEKPRAIGERYLAIKNKTN